jgi:hypothetical protein
MNAGGVHLCYAGWRGLTTKVSESKTVAVIPATIRVVRRRMIMASLRYKRVSNSMIEKLVAKQFNCDQVWRSLTGKTPETSFPRSVRKPSS